MFNGPWFDGHLDLTYIALHGRDLRKPADACGGKLEPAGLTFPALHAAGVTRAISMLFVRQQTAQASGPYCFSSPDEAHRSALEQVRMHQVWQEEGWIQMAAQTPAALKPKTQNANAAPLDVTLAMEGAAPIRHLDDADVFHAAGVRMVCLAWAEGTVWAGGDQSGGDLTSAGRTLVGRLDQLGIVHDVSHLSERAFWSLLDCAKGPVVASHSNCRSLLPGSKFPERHLSDDQLRALAQRPNARVGINLFARFILPPDELARRRATIADLLTHVRHIEQLTGRRDLLALGSDFDSGFTSELLPADLQCPQDLPRLAEALSAEGWSDAEVIRFAGNWEGLLYKT